MPRQPAVRGTGAAWYRFLRLVSEFPPRLSRGPRVLRGVGPSRDVDASALLMPLTFFMAPNDPRMLATVDAIRSPATSPGVLVTA